MWGIFIAIVSHKLFEAFALGMQIVTIAQQF